MSKTGSVLTQRIIFWFAKLLPFGHSYWISSQTYAARGRHFLPQREHAFPGATICRDYFLSMLDAVCHARPHVENTKRFVMARNFR
jgi:hypothetical protein